MINESLIISRAKWFYLSRYLLDIDECIRRAIYDLTPLKDLCDAYTLFDITINDLVIHFKRKIAEGK